MPSKSCAALGIHVGHDRCASLVIDGKLSFHIAQERLDRIKYSESPDLPIAAIRSVLSSAGVQFRDLASVSISYVNSEIDRYRSYYIDLLEENFGKTSADFHLVPHHLAHAYSAYHTSAFNKCLIYIADGAGDVADGDQFEAESLFLADGQEITPIAVRRQDITPDFHTGVFFYNAALIAKSHKAWNLSIGKKYEQFTYLLGFDAFENGKTMGLSSYGRPLFECERWEGGTFDFELTMMDGLQELEAVRTSAGLSFPAFVDRHRGDIAMSGQRLAETLMERQLRAAHRLEPKLPVAMAGGVALNCVANNRVLSRVPFPHAYIFPASGDDGQSVGAAFFGYHKTKSSPWSTGTRFTPYLGPAYAPREIRQALEAHGLKYRTYPDDELVHLLSQCLADNQIVGMFRGRSEMGPRALCHRSLLANPGNPDMKDYLNKHVKYREEFRPYAPVVTAEDQHRYFDLAHASPHMLLAGDVRPEHWSKLPAITHVDGTARVQALAQEDDLFIHALLKAMVPEIGSPILLNTSFNVAGEPIVETPRDAIACFLRTNIDVLVLDSFFVSKRQQASA
jgi:carbamoyltransferase